MRLEDTDSRRLELHRAVFALVVAMRSHGVKYDADDARQAIRDGGLTREDINNAELLANFADVLADAIKSERKTLGTSQAETSAAIVKGEF
jgi:hypothetical protein